MDFYEKYSNYTEEQLLEILKKRKDYQESAVDAAIKIAIERKIIFSEQDLFSPEFEPVESKGSKIFPEISNSYQREKLIGSILRFLYVISFLPLVFGFLKYAEGRLLFTYLGVGVGLIWFLLCFFLSKTKKRFLFFPLFVLLISVSFFVGYQIFSVPSVRFLDLFMLFIGTALPTYLLLLLRRLM
jgi:hypothetical protein